MASKNGHFEIIKILLQDPRVDLFANNYMAIRMARKSVVEMLICHIVTRKLLYHEIIKKFINDNLFVNHIMENYL